LQTNHPEWFVRGADGMFQSPGAWGVTWEDLVELEHRHVPLWDRLAEALLVWCRRGVDGFRCDAGYKVPLAAWQYITARYGGSFRRRSFCSKGWVAPGKSPRNYWRKAECNGRIPNCFRTIPVPRWPGIWTTPCGGGRVGLLVNYSETHDNERLSARGPEWSRLRNRLLRADGGERRIRFHLRR